MNVIKVGDIVTRISYNNDVYFRVIGVRPDGNVDLIGTTLRLRADAPAGDLALVKPNRSESLAKARERLITTNLKLGRLHMHLGSCWETHAVRKNPRHI